MIANSRPLYFVPHAGVSMPWQDYQYVESVTALLESKRKHQIYAHPGDEHILACTSYSTDVRHVSSLPLSGVQAPGLIFVSNRFQESKVSVSTINSMPQASVGFQQSFAHNMYQLLMLG